MPQLHYRSAGPGHYINGLSRAGDKVLLEDRSVWALDPADLPRVRRWTQWSAIEVRDTGGTGYMLVCRCNGREERVLVGFRGFLSESPAMPLAS